MTVERLDIVRRSPFAHGYQRLDGVLRFAVHPESKEATTKQSA